MAKEMGFHSLAGSFIKQPLQVFVLTGIGLRDACLRKYDGGLRLCNVNANFCFVYCITRSAELPVPWFYSVAFGNNIRRRRRQKSTTELEVPQNRKSEDACGAWAYLTNAIATPPSTFNTLPVDLCSRPPIKTKQALAISSGKIISFNSVRLA